MKIIIKLFLMNILYTLQNKMYYTIIYFGRRNWNYSFSNTTYRELALRNKFLKLISVNLLISTNALE